MRSRLDPALEDVWDGLRTRPGRAALSFSAIAVAAASLAALLAVLGGLQDKSRRMAEELGADVVAVLRQAGIDRDSGEGLQERHARLLAGNLPGWSFATVRGIEASTLGSRRKVSVLATDSSLMDIRRWRLTEGRFLDPPDIRHRRRSAVVSESLSKLWGWKAGDLIMLQNVPFNVVGVIRIGSGEIDAETGNPSLSLGERVVFVPRTAMPFWAPSASGQSSLVDAIFMRVPASEEFDRGVSAAQGLLLQDGRLKGISWVTPQSLVQGIKRLQRTLALAIGSVVMVSLLSGGTALTSLMVSNVRERVTEIGLRRALGAAREDIASLFILEACVVAGTAASTATLAAHAALALGGHWLPVPLHLGWASVLTPIIVSLGVGIAFSLWPARHAAGISPAEALRAD